MSGDFARYGLTVTAANVLGIRQVILEEAHALDASIDDFRRAFPNGMPELGGDPVSKDAAKGFTEVTETLLRRGQAHIDGLFELGEQLAAAARSYGHTEQTITDSFNGVGPGQPTSLTPIQQLPPPLRGIAAGGPPALAQSWRDFIYGSGR